MVPTQFPPFSAHAHWVMSSHRCPTGPRTLKTCGIHAIFPFQTQTHLVHSTHFESRWDSWTCWKLNSERPTNPQQLKVAMKVWQSISGEERVWRCPWAPDFRPSSVIIWFDMIFDYDYMIWYMIWYDVWFDMILIWYDIRSGILDIMVLG